MHLPRLTYTALFIAAALSCSALVAQAAPPLKTSPTKPGSGARQYGPETFRIQPAIYRTETTALPGPAQPVEAAATVPTTGTPVQPVTWGRYRYRSYYGSSYGYYGGSYGGYYGGGYYGYRPARFYSYRYNYPYGYSGYGYTSYGYRGYSNPYYAGYSGYATPYYSARYYAGYSTPYYAGYVASPYPRYYGYGYGGGYYYAPYYYSPYHYGIGYYW